MYLDSYVTTLVHSRGGSCAAGAGRREPADDAGPAGPRPGPGRGTGRQSARPPAPATAGERAGTLPIPRPGVSRPLRVLREAGLVEVRSDAQRRVYSLRAQPLAEVDHWLGRYRARWEQRLDALHTEIARGKRERGSS